MHYIGVNDLLSKYLSQQKYRSLEYVGLNMCGEQNILLATICIIFYLHKSIPTATTSYLLNVLYFNLLDLQFHIDTHLRWIDTRKKTNIDSFDLQQNDPFNNSNSSYYMLLATQVVQISVYISIQGSLWIILVSKYSLVHMLAYFFSTMTDFITYQQQKFHASYYFIQEYLFINKIVFDVILK